MKKTVTACLTVAALALGPLAAFAQENIKRVGSNTDWAVFEAFEPTECWAATTPTKTESLRDGREVSMKRGDILLAVTWRPGDKVAGEVSFAGGYVFAEGSTARLDIGDSSFELFTQGDYAWPSPADDREIVTALKRGASAVITARSAQGTETRDTFSLFGATATIEAAEKRCAR